MLVTKVSKDYGLAIKLSCQMFNDRNYTASNIIDEYQKLSVSHDSKMTVFSTNLSVVASKLNRIGKVLFYNTNEDLFYLADVKDIFSFTKSIDCEQSGIDETLVPIPFRGKYKTRIFVGNFKKVTLDEVGSYFIEGMNMSFKDFLIDNSKARTPRVYFKL